MYHLYVVKGWPVIVDDSERAPFTSHQYIGAFEDPHELVRTYDELRDWAVAASPTED